MVGLRRQRETYGERVLPRPHHPQDGEMTMSAHAGVVDYDMGGDLATHHPPPRCWENGPSLRACSVPDDLSVSYMRASLDGWQTRRATVPRRGRSRTNPGSTSSATSPVA